MVLDHLRGLTHSCYCQGRHPPSWHHTQTGCGRTREQLALAQDRQDARLALNDWKQPKQDGDA